MKLILILIITLSSAHAFDRNIYSSFYDAVTDTQVVKYIDGSVEFLVGKHDLPKISQPPEIFQPFDYVPGEPSIIPKYSYAQNVMDQFKMGNLGDSQCYDRAHVWTFEALKNRIVLNKMFIFFADHYIAQYKFPWWFHVAPYALVKVKGEVGDRVMDPIFSTVPLKTKLWTDLLMKNKAECKVITSYSEFSTRPGTEDCFLMKASPYFWQPKDLEEVEKSGNFKKSFIDWEVKWAYLKAYGIEL